MENQAELLSQLIPAIHDIRKDLLNEGCAMGADEEVAELLRRLVHLEQAVVYFDDLDIIRNLKAVIADYVDLDTGTSPSSSSSTTEATGIDTSMAKFSHKQGLEQCE